MILVNLRHEENGKHSVRSCDSVFESSRTHEWIPRRFQPDGVLKRFSCDSITSVGYHSSIESFAVELWKNSGRRVAHAPYFSFSREKAAASQSWQLDPSHWTPCQPRTQSDSNDGRRTWKLVNFQIRFSSQFSKACVRARRVG